MLGFIVRAIRQFGREERGVVLILFLLVFMPLLITAAVVIDFSQTLVVKRQLTGAVDSAALTLGTLMNIQDPAALNNKAEGYIRANYPDSSIGTLTAWSAVRDVDSHMINVSATAEIPTAFLGITGKDKWTVTVNSGVFQKDNKLEVVMVLDNSGSMAGSKIADMKNAATDLVNTLFGEDEVSDKVKIGLVPFTAGVNVGVPYDTTFWLDRGNPSRINPEVIDDLVGTETTWTVLESMQGGISNWGGCLRARAEPYDILDTPPDPADPDTLFAPQFNPAKGKKKGAYKGKPKTTENEGCPTAQIQPLTNVKSTITTAIDAMVANGNTNIPEGLAWGWHIISRQDPFTEGVAYSDKSTIKAIILLTDGENSVDGVFSSFGPGDATNIHIGPVVDAGLDAKLTALCQNIKANQDGIDDGDDIVVYTIAFAVSGPILTRLSNCASNATKAFTADTVSGLRSTFAAIAAGLNELRLAN